MAAAVKAEHGHSGGDSAGDAGDGVLDDEAARGRRLHLCGGKQEQVRRGLAMTDLLGGKYIWRKAVVKSGAAEADLRALVRAAGRHADRKRDAVERVGNMGN